MSANSDLADIPEADGKHPSFLNIITELIAGYAWPGKAIANMCVKCYGYNSIKHGLDFAQDLKLGQYMKIPPRVLFVGQLYSSVLATATQTGGRFLKQCNPRDYEVLTSGHQYCAG